jgi:hypothetical protein
MTIDSKAIIICFAPGAFGFLLGKWLINNQLATPMSPQGQMLDYNFDPDGTNHDYLPYYINELTTTARSNPRAQGMPSIEDDLHMGIIESDSIKNFPPTDLPKLIHSHSGSQLAVEALKKQFTNARIIKIVITKQQAIDSIIRKSNSYDDLEKRILNPSFDEFIDKPGPDIDVTLDQVLTLDLKWLKEKL